MVALKKRLYTNCDHPSFLPFHLEVMCASSYGEWWEDTKDLKVCPQGASNCYLSPLHQVRNPSGGIRKDACNMHQCNVAPHVWSTRAGVSIKSFLVPDSKGPSRLSVCFWNFREASDVNDSPHDSVLYLLICTAAPPLPKLLRHAWVA